MFKKALMIITVIALIFTIACVTPRFAVGSCYVPSTDEAQFNFKNTTVDGYVRLVKTDGTVVAGPFFLGVGDELSERIPHPHNTNSITLKKQFSVNGVDGWVNIGGTHSLNTIDKFYYYMETQGWGICDAPVEPPVAARVTNNFTYLHVNLEKAEQVSPGGWYDFYDVSTGGERLLISIYMFPGMDDSGWFYTNVPRAEGWGIVKFRPDSGGPAVMLDIIDSVTCNNYGTCFWYNGVDDNLRANAAELAH